MVAAKARATFRGVFPCGAGNSRQGDTRSMNNENYNPSSDAYYNVRLGRGRYMFNSCNSGFDTWLRVMPGTYQENSGYASCADRNNYQGTNCASCDDCGGCGTRTVLGITITEPGWYTLLVEGYSNSRGAFNVVMEVQAGGCGIGFTAEPTTSAPTTLAPTTSAPTTPAPTSYAPTSHPTRNPTRNPTKNPTRNPTRGPSSSQPTNMPSPSPTTGAPTRNPTTDRCRLRVCSMDCNSRGCGWSRIENACLSINGWNVFETSLATRDALLEANPNACRRYYTEEPTPAPPTQPGNSQGSEAGDDEDSNGSTLVYIVVVGVVFLVCIMAALLVLSRPSDNTQHYRSDGPGAIVAFQNPQYEAPSGEAGGYIDVKDDSE